MAKKAMKYKVEDWQVAWHSAKTEEERRQAVDDYEEAKLYNAELREQARLDRAVAVSRARRMFKRNLLCDLKKLIKIRHR